MTDKTATLMRTAWFMGAVGIILVAAGVGRLLISTSWGPWGAASVGAGALCLFAAATIHRRALVAFARRRATRRTTSTLVYVAAIAGMLLLVNLFARSLVVRWDVTAEHAHTLSDQTLTVLAELTQPITIRAFISRTSPLRADVETLVRKYERVSPELRVEIIDPEQRPSEAREYEVSAIGSVVVETAGRRQVISPLNLYELGPTIGDAALRGEQTLTRTILQMTRQTGAFIYFTTGHGEARSDVAIRRAFSYLRGEGYRVGEVNLARARTMPEDADVVVTVGPTIDLGELERSALEAFLDRGGRLLLLIGLTERDRSLVNWRKLLLRLGMELQDTMVVDPSRAYFLDPLSPVPVLLWHPLTQKIIMANMAMTLPRSRSLGIAPSSPSLAVEPILRSSPDAWGETQWWVGFDRDGDDLPGPLNLALAVTRPLNPGEAIRPGTGASPGPTAGSGSAGSTQHAQRAVALVVGSPYFVSDELFGFQGNGDFFIGAVEWLLGEEHLISIRPTTPLGRPVFLTSSDARLIFNLAVVWIPLTMLATGGAVWVHRRRL